MGIRKDERDIYNLAATQVDRTNEALLELYTDNLEKAQHDLLKLRASVTRSGVIRPFKEERLLTLIRNIQNNIIDLRVKSTSIIRSGFRANYVNTYYLENWAFEKSVNVELGANVLLNLPPLDNNAIIAGFDQRIGGHLLKDRTLRVQREMQFLVQSAVSQNIIQGQSVKELAKNLDLLGEVYDKGLGNTTRIARTELLRAYSLGQDQSRIEAENSGVEFIFEWDARLDSKVRPDHARADKQKAVIVDGEPVFTVGGVRFLTPRVPVISTGSKAEKKQVINCRCRRLNLPFGIEPTSRTAKTKDGEWVSVNGDLTAEEWIKKEYGVSLKST